VTWPNGIASAEGRSKRSTGSGLKGGGYVWCGPNFQRLCRLGGPSAISRPENRPEITSTEPRILLDNCPKTGRPNRAHKSIREKKTPENVCPSQRDPIIRAQIWGRRDCLSRDPHGPDLMPRTAGPRMAEAPQGVGQALCQAPTAFHCRWSR